MKFVVAHQLLRERRPDPLKILTLQSRRWKTIRGLPLFIVGTQEGFKKQIGIVGGMTRMPSRPTN